GQSNPEIFSHQKFPAHRVRARRVSATFPQSLFGLSIPRESIDPRHASAPRKAIAILRQAFQFFAAAVKANMANWDTIDGFPDAQPAGKCQNARRESPVPSCPRN